MPTDAGDTGDIAALEHVRDVAEQIKKMRRDYTNLMLTMRDAIRAADGEASRNEIVRAAEGGLSRGKVYSVLGVADLLAAAQKVIGDDARWTVFERTPGVVELSADVARTPRDELAFKNGTVQADAIDLLRDLWAAGIKAIGDDPAAALARFEDVELTRVKD